MKKLRSLLRRLKKGRPTVWVKRHEAARAKLWSRLMSSPPSEAHLSRAERAMARLTSLRPPWDRWEHAVYGVLITPIALFPPRKSSL